MVFSSAVFLFIFFPAVFILYYAVPLTRFRNALLVVASLFFYAFGEPVYVVLMLASVAVNYLLGRCAAAEKWAKAAVAVAVAVNIMALAVFKYAGFFIENLNAVFALAIPRPAIRLPVGISFFTFQALSYVIDVYRDRNLCQRNILKLTLFISFFPQLIAGPIVKYGDIAKQIDDRKASLEDVASGLRRFICGLSKKLLIANTAGYGADVLFEMSGGNAVTAWTGAFLYCLQIYHDFSGYSDMAIGLGRIFGFRFKENFRHPYAAKSLQSFWRGWHISLSEWFRDYLYIPLGGNRLGKIRTVFNKYAVFFLTGLWHGASWNFVIWGLMHGTFLVLEDGPLKILKRRVVAGRIYMLLVVSTAFALFRAETPGAAFSYIINMFSGFRLDSEVMSVFMTLLTPRLIFAALMGIIFSLPAKEMLCTKLRINGSALEMASYAAALMLAALCILNLSSATFNPFIYFRF